MIAPGFSPHAKRPLDWLLKTGCEVIFMDLINPYPESCKQYQFISYSPLQIKGLRYYRKVLGNRLCNSLVEWYVTQKLKKLWRQIKPDLVHIHWVDQRAYYFMKAGLKPLVLSVWGSDINQHFLPNADIEYRRMIVQVLASSNMIIVDSSDMPRKCETLAGCKLPIEMLPLGIDTNLFRPNYYEAAQEWRKKLTIPIDTKVLLSNRGWSESYGHHMVLEAFANALPKLKRNSILVFKLVNQSKYPDSKDYKKKIHQRIKELDISRSIRWIEEVSFSQLPEIYALADIIVNYPLLDAFPVSFMEAAACERSVITCRLPAYLGTFAEKYFQMVEPENPTALADAIVKMINDVDHQRKSFLTEARKLIKKEYDERNSSQKLVEIYKRII